MNIGRGCFVPQCTSGKELMIWRFGALDRTLFELRVRHSIQGMVVGTKGDWNLLWVLGRIIIRVSIRPRIWR
jgi:hypothetical protein